MKPSPPGRLLSVGYEEWENQIANHSSRDDRAPELTESRGVPQLAEEQIHNYHHVDAALKRRRQTSSIGLVLNSLSGSSWAETSSGASREQAALPSYSSRPTSPTGRRKMAQKFVMFGAFCLSVVLPTTIHVLYLSTLERGDAWSFGTTSATTLSTAAIGVTSPHRLLSDTKSDDDDTFGNLVGSVALPKRSIKPSSRPNYGGLEFQSTRLNEKTEGDMLKSGQSKFQRNINPMDDALFERYRHSLLKATSELEHELWASKEDNPWSEDECAHPSFVGHYRSNCNSFHEIDFGHPVADLHAQNQTQDDIQLLGHGYYRDAWLLRDENAKRYQSSSYVVKRIRFKRDIDYEILEQVANDAMVMDQLSESPYIVDMHGFCGASVSVESLEREVKSQVIEPPPQAALTTTGKLNLALDMARGVASLHGHPGGTIVDVDIALKQWMFSSDGRAKLGDFNRAEALQWYPKKQRYCKISLDFAGGYYRSPEEYMLKAFNEKADVYSLGNALYAVLIGQTTSDALIAAGLEDKLEAIQDAVIHGRIIPIDKKRFSGAEARMAEVIHHCLATKPKDRIDIFEVVRMLEDAVELEKAS